MMIRNTLTSLATMAAVAICLTLTQTSHATPCYYGSYIYLAINEGVGPNGAYSPEIVNGLRDSGYAAMEDMQTQHQSILERIKQFDAQTKNTKTPAGILQERAELVKFRDNLELLIDQVAQQRNATTSGLMWYTSLDKAIKKANETNKPILSLRMLGKLTDEYSCANSRFFRTTLYSNKEISAKLRKDFVLHWKSVRPVPKISIDFGDGRTLERTITGNSAHYMLDKSGRPLDCLPGLYGPGEFKNWLGKMAELDLATRDLKTASKNEKLKSYHLGRNMIAGMTLESEMAKLDPKFANDVSNDFEELAPAAKRIPARQAAPRAVSKSLGEAPILDLAFDERSIDSFEEKMDDAKWEQLARLHAGSEKLDDSSIAIIKRENPSATDASSLTRAKRKTEDKLTRLVESFERSILIDTVRNEYLLHRRIHRWFAVEVPTDVEVLNKRVYAELFLTPDTDPWLGLKPENVYTALENDGVKVAAKK